MTASCCIVLRAQCAFALQGSIPYVPYLRAPYYVWVGHMPQLASVLRENKVCLIQLAHQRK